MLTVERAKGWYGKAAVAERAAARRARHAAVTERKRQEAAERAAVAREHEVRVEAALRPVRDYAAKRLASLPPKSAKASAPFRRSVEQQAKRIRHLLEADRKGAERKVGPTKNKRTKMVVPTDERLAKGDHSEWVNPAEIDSSEQEIGLTRRFKSSHLDRFYRNGRLTWVQWYAGDWLRNLHARCSFSLSVVASYGGRSGGGGEPNYGLPRTEAQLRARQIYMEARKAFPPTMIGFMERLLIHDELPRFGGRAAMRQTKEIAAALDALAGWFGLPSAAASDGASPKVKRLREIARTSSFEGERDNAARLADKLEMEEEAGQAAAAAVADAAVERMRELHPDFFDEAGRMKPMADIRDIIVKRLAEEPEEKAA